MTSRPTRPRALLDFISRPILKDVAPTGTLKRIFTGKSGPEQEKNIGRVIYASETFQNCKNPTGHIDTLSPNSDQHEISPCNIDAHSTPEDMRIKDVIMQGEFS